MNAAKPIPGFDAPILAVNGVPYDLRGVVAFGSLPTSSGKHQALVGIPINQRSVRLHFHASTQTAGKSLRLRVHYVDQQVREFPLNMSQDWDHPVAWDNPRPETEIAALHLISQPNSETALAATTVQTGPGPIIQTHPNPTYSQIAVGQPLELKVVTTAPGPWAYQWTVNDTPIAGATDATLRIASVTPQDFARYQVEIRYATVDPANTPTHSRPMWVVDAANPIVYGEWSERLYLNVPDSGVESLLNSDTFPDRPDVVGSVTAVEASPNVGDNFGRRLTGWLVPKESADYVFYLCSDDASRLSISTDESSANLAQIAKLSGFTMKPRSWETLDPESISKPIRLEAGKRYFVEVLHKDGEGGDHASVTWRKVGEPAPKNDDPPIGGEFLERPIELPPDGTTAAAELAIAEGRTREAVGHLAATSAAHPDDTLLALKVAALQVWFGDEKEYAATCMRALEFAQATPDPATLERTSKICSLQPTQDTVRLESSLAFARKAVELGRADSTLPWFHLALGMAEYRLGHFAEADAALVAAAESGGDVYNSSGLTQTAAFYRAMSLFQQGIVDEARQLATETAATFKPLPKDELNPLAANATHDNLILWLAYKEAKALIPLEPDQPSTSPSNGN